MRNIWSNGFGGLHDGVHATIIQSYKLDTMTNSLSLSKIDNVSFIKTGLIAAAVIVMALPAMASAATYAYVDQGGYIRSVSADSAGQAMVVGPNIDENSGVRELNSPDDYLILGMYVKG